LLCIFSISLFCCFLFSFIRINLSGFYSQKPRISALYMKFRGRIKDTIIVLYTLMFRFLD
jgi:hypothetical protein